MSVLINIEIGTSGVQRVVSRPTTISEASKAAELSAKTAFAIRLLHETIVGDSDSVGVAPINEHGYLFVPRGEINGEYVEFEKVELYVPPAPRDLFNNPATWLVDAMKRAYPNHSFWKHAEDLDGGEEEAATSILAGHGHTNNGFLDHAGWIDEDNRGAILVSEPYDLTLDAIEDLRSLCQNAGLTYRIVGFSNHYPSRTLRIEIWRPQ